MAKEVNQIEAFNIIDTKAREEIEKLNKKLEQGGTSSPTDADGITIKDENDYFTATNVEGALSELFQSVSNGKQLIATAITDKGVNTSSDDTFQTIATNIESIQNSGLNAENITFDQENDVVKEYIQASSSYTSDNYSTVSVIEEYANKTTAYRKDRPNGYTQSLSQGVLTIIDEYNNGCLNENILTGDKVIENMAPNHNTICVCKAENNISFLANVNSTGAIRMINGYSNSFNIRDLGGWSCDGGTLNYGKLFRGCELSGDNYNVTLTDEEKNMYCNLLKIEEEIDFRSDSEVDGADQTYETEDDIVSSVFGDNIGYVRYPIDAYHPGVNLWNTKQTEYYKNIIKRIVENLRNGKVTYFHCMAGADRTGTVAMLIEALCGVSQVDCDRDYELTSFSTGNLRKRTDSAWVSLIDYINTLQGDIFRDKVMCYMLQAGVTIDEINDLRKYLINGSPQTLTSPFTSYTITNTLDNVNTSNKKTSTEPYQSYVTTLSLDKGDAFTDVQVLMDGIDITSSVFTGNETLLKSRIIKELENCTSINTYRAAIYGESYVDIITPMSGCEIDSVVIKMGGVDVSTYYKNGIINIPNVTGNIVIKATAVQVSAYTNLLPKSLDNDLASIYNQFGYKDGTYMSTAVTALEGTDTTSFRTGFITLPVTYKSGVTCNIYIYSPKELNFTASHTRFASKKSNGTYSGDNWADMTSTNKLSTYFNIETLGTGYYKLSPIDSAWGSYECKYLAFSFVCTDGTGTGENVIITCNEEITD